MMLCCITVVKKTLRSLLGIVMHPKTQRLESTLFHPLYGAATQWEQHQRARDLGCRCNVSWMVGNGEGVGVSILSKDLTIPMLMYLYVHLCAYHRYFQL